MLEIMIPQLNDLFENKNEVYVQQDGAPPHFHINVRNFLDHTVNQRWIGRRGSATEFPPRSPDLTPLDYYLWRTEFTIHFHAKYENKNEQKYELRVKTRTRGVNKVHFPVDPELVNHLLRDATACT